LNPIILYDNRFEDGALSATNTATGYDVNNIKDLRTHTYWKANAAGTLYITEAPLAKDTLAQEEMRIVPADGYAGVYLPASLDLTPYLGDRIVCLDSALKKHIGYIKSVSTDDAINLTVSAADASMVVADDDDIDFGPGNFTLRWKGALPDYTPAAGLYLLNKMEGASPNLFGYQLYLHTDGTLYVVLGTNSAPRNYQSTAAISATAGTIVDIIAVITRETASTAGSVVFYVYYEDDTGGQLGSSVAIGAAAATTLSNAADLYINGGSSFRNASINTDVTLYNRALTSAQALDLHDNGVAAADQYGSQTAKSSDTEWTGASGATPPTGWIAADAAVHTIVDSGDGAPFDVALKYEVNNGGGYSRLRKNYTVEIGKKYRFECYFKHGDSTRGRISLGSTAGGGEYYVVTNLTDATWTKYGVEFTATTTLASIQLMAYGVAGKYEYYDECKIYEIGATLDLNESGIQDTGWEDASTNENDAAYPASGYAIVTKTDIVSTPDGTTYNWESIDSGFDHADAAGYAYKISESDAADALGIDGHNLGTAGAAVSVESSDDESTWTERLAAFNPSDDTAILKTMTSFQAASKRLKIVTASVAPYLAVAMLGNKLEFNRGAYIGDGAIVPWQFGIVASAQRSKTGNLLGNSIRYKPIDISMTIPTDIYDWFNEYFWPFWRDHGSELKSFFFAPDLTTFTDKIFWMQLTEDSVLAPPMLVKDRVDNYTFSMQGVLEE
jgi:hypothetical protein